MDNRETKKLTTPSGKEVEIKTYMTARERNGLRAVYLKNAEINVSQGESAIKGFSASVADEAEKKLLELVVVNFDGKSDEILDRILDGTPEDYDFIVLEANKSGIGSFQKAN